ncbi:hypothetical protein LUW75_07780 [Streptomyces sp. MRC013]|uniref:hypothetical protein n=1 Tax=Streptomyces sp. MRC013 TaxID=2898276 RepID=UPI0020273A76|nr:hypothetical protein [Streptomyces sp. MRC013]URM89904.1 hypothetical protein LUW75_07780 [Streptomyces sp. MRC013]
MGGPEPGDDASGPGPPTADRVHRAPRVPSHDHLAGDRAPARSSPRSARGHGAPPGAGPDRPGRWFREAPAHTCAVAQARAREALLRTAAECAEDLDEDGVGCAEVRHVPEQHPEGGLVPGGVVAVDIDDRLTPGTGPSRECEPLTEAFDHRFDDMRRLTVNAMKSAFIPFDERLAVIDDVTGPGCAERDPERLFGQTATTSASAREEVRDAAAGSGRAGPGAPRPGRLRCLRDAARDG